MNKPIAFFDLETTGTSTTKDRIVSIASLKVNHDFTTDGDLREMLLNPGIPIPQEAADVHGITNEMVQGKPIFANIAKALFAYLDGCDIGGYNSIDFDVPLLSEEFLRVGIHWPAPGTRFFDACRIFKEKFPRTLTGAVKYYLGRDHEGAHGAGADILATVDVFQKQLLEYEDLSNMTPDELHTFCVGANSIDLAGKIVRNAAGEACYNFGKDKGKIIRENPGFAHWMLKPETDLPSETKRIVREILHGNKMF